MKRIANCRLSKSIEIRRELNPAWNVVLRVIFRFHWKFRAGGAEGEIHCDAIPPPTQLLITLVHWRRPADPLKQTQCVTMGHGPKHTLRLEATNGEGIFN